MNIAAVPAFAGGVLEGVARALQVAPPSEWPPELVDKVTRTCQDMAQALRADRSELEAALGGGAPAHALLTLANQLLQFIDKHGALADRVREAKAMSVALPDEVDALFTAVLDVHAEFDAIRALAAPIVAKVKAPPPPIDAARLEAGREAIRKGDFRVYSDADDMARDLADG